MSLKVCIFFILFSTCLYSNDTNSTYEDNYIDKIHLVLSDKVEYLSTATDDFIVDKINFISSFGKDETKIASNKVDTLFKNEKFIDETRKSFVILSVDGQHNSLGSDDLNAKLSARLALSKSTRILNLFINSFNQDNINDVFQKSDYAENKPEIGLSIIRDVSKNIESRYSLGLRSLSPFTRARFSITDKIGIWDVQPVQILEYSLKDKFKEYTRLYLDTQIVDKILFRTELGRGSRSEVNGMDYSGAFHLFWTPQPKTGLQFTQAFYGNTKYEYTIDTLTGETQRFSGINNYLTQLTFRQNIYRKWLFYEVSPGVNFSKANDFDPNYRLFVKLDFFFGKM